MKFTRKTGKHWFILIAINLCLFVFLLTPVSFEEFKTNSSLRILSLEKASIGNKTNVSGAFRDWVSLDQYPKHVLQTVIFAEDKRFYNHPGFDPIAMLRALYSLVNWNEKTNGGSTITQQLVRIQNPKIRSLPGYVRKPLEILTSVRYTIWLSKRKYWKHISIRFLFAPIMKDFLPSVGSIFENMFGFYLWKKEWLLRFSFVPIRLL